MDSQMEHIDLEKGKILHDGNWFSDQELAEKIQEKIQSGDMKFARLAALLEELNAAMENTQVLETKIILTKQQYEKLTLLGGGNENEAVHKAVLAFIETDSIASVPEDPAPEVTFTSADQSPAQGTTTQFVEAGGTGKKAVINCSKCNAPIQIDVDDMPPEIRCPTCNAKGVLKIHKSKPQFKEHYLG
ncbi:MAG: hypothetical protein SWH68_16670 [Thermodesulfobacteriota bacterium]|nr:hypothetical protein [Thermodesulfobacteriota bacterium]